MKCEHMTSINLLVTLYCYKEISFCDMIAYTQWTTPFYIFFYNRVFIFRTKYRNGFDI